MLWLLVGGCLTSQQHASVSPGRADFGAAPGL